MKWNIWSRPIYNCTCNTKITLECTQNKLFLCWNDLLELSFFDYWKLVHLIIEWSLNRFLQSFFFFMWIKNPTYLSMQDLVFNQKINVYPIDSKMNKKVFLKNYKHDWTQTVNVNDQWMVPYQAGRLDFSLSWLKGEVRENLGDFRKSIQILTFLSPLPHVPLPFTKTNNDLKRMQLTSLE